MKSLRYTYLIVADEHSAARIMENALFMPYSEQCLFLDKRFILKARLYKETSELYLAFQLAFESKRKLNPFSV